MTRAKQPRTPAPDDLSRRELLGATASAGALLALSPQMLPAQLSDRGPRSRTFFLNLSHENYRGHDYFLHIAGQRHRLVEMSQASATALRLLQTNSFLSALPSGKITHVLEGTLLPADQVLLTYMSKDPNYSSGEWEMTCMYLIPPASSLAYAYQRARALAGDQVDLPLSAKRATYGVHPARSYTDLVEESMLLDNTDWAAAMVNVHPEILSADGNSAAHVQTNYVQTNPNVRTLSVLLGNLGPAQPQTGDADNAMGWATLVPYRDADGKQIRSDKGHNKGLIQYDARWNTRYTKSYIVAAITGAVAKVKSDVTLGVDVTAPGTAGSLRGTLWTRSDGVAAIDQTAEPAQSSGAKFTLTNVTPNFNGYSCELTSSGTTLTLKATNWYLRYLGLYIEFLKDDGSTTSVVPVSQLPPKLVPNPDFTVDDTYAFLSQINPEFTIYGIPIQSSSSMPFTLEFPPQATSARVIASGLGCGGRPAQDTETLGIILTSLFKLIVPAALFFVGAGTFVDGIVKTFGVPICLTLVQFLEAAVVKEGPTAVATLLWRAVAKGGATPFAKACLAIAAYIALGNSEAAAEDAIPIAGSIIQAIGLLAITAELATTAIEVDASPWSYIYTLAGTYDLSLTVLPDPNNNHAFPASAVRYTITAIFNNGTPRSVTNSVAGGSREAVTTTLSSVPLGGQVVLSVGFYSADGNLVGHATTGSIPNVPSVQEGSNPSVTLTELQQPISAATVYEHKQHTALATNGDHQWICGPAPAFPSVTENCSAQPGSICKYRSITVSTQTGNVGYAWNGYTANGCDTGTGLLDQVANVEIASAGSDVQDKYAALSCALSGTAHLVYDPLGRSDVNFYLDATESQKLLRSVTLGGKPAFQDPKTQTAWGAFSLPSSDLLLHPSGVVLSINEQFGRLEALTLPAGPVSEKQATTDLVATLHCGCGTRPGLLSGPILATVTSSGVVLVLEKGNNRIHAVDAAGNPIRHFTGQREPYYLVLTETGSEATYLDMAAEYSGLIYVLSLRAGIYRLDIYDPKSAGTAPISTTRNFNAAKIAVDYWRNVYSLNYATLNGTGDSLYPAEPQISQWIPTTQPSSCATDRQPARARLQNTRLLRRRALLAFRPTEA